MKRQSLLNTERYETEDIKFAQQFLKDCNERSVQAYVNADKTIEVHGVFSAEEIQKLGMLACIPIAQTPDWIA